MASISTVVSIAELAGLAYVAWKAWSFIKTGDIMDLPAADWIAEYFESVAWQVTVPPGKNQEAVDYCISAGMTAEMVAAKIEAKVPLLHPHGQQIWGGLHVPAPKVCEFGDGFLVLNHFYMNLKESTVTGGVGFLENDDKLWNETSYVIFKEWATEQLEQYVQFANHLGYAVAQ